MEQKGHQNLITHYTHINYNLLRQKTPDSQQYHDKMDNNWHKNQSKLRKIKNSIHEWGNGTTPS